MLRRSLLVAALTAASGCAGFKPLKTPMDRIAQTLPEGRGAQHLIVFLPGAYDQPQDFFDQGFVSELRGRRLAADLIALDSHLGYFNDATIAERIQREVLVPAQAQGYQRIWLVGISLGGLGAMLTAARHPGVSGLIAIAPYVGTREAMAEVRRAGGFARWRAQDSQATNAWERDLYQWFANRLQSPAPAPRLVLGYGRQDRFADTISVLAQTLPAASVVTIDGGHDWPTWRLLWREILDRVGAELAPTLATSP